MQLRDHAAVDSRLGLVGILKKVPDDNDNILEYYENFFNNPLYMDDAWHVYKAMGKRMLTMETLKAGVQRLMPRYKSKGIPMRFEGGDRFMMGGVLIFDRKGNLCFSYEEAYGEELNMEVIKEAIDEIRLMDKSRRSLHSSCSSESAFSMSSDTEQRFL